MLAAALGICVSSAGAQRAHTGWLQPGGRVDVFAANLRAVQVGGDLSARAGRYVRLGLVAAGGGSWEQGERSESAELSGRVDLVGRFVLDPDFTARWAPYAGGGLGVRYDRIAVPDWRATLIVMLGLEGPNLNGVVPFFELGYGGGARLGLGFRKVLAQGR